MYSSSFQAFTDTTSFLSRCSGASTTSDASALERDRTNEIDDEITGGRIRAQDGSGALEIVKPKVVEKGAKDQEVQVKYTSVSNLAHILRWFFSHLALIVQGQRQLTIFQAPLLSLLCQRLLGTLYQPVGHKVSQQP